LHGRLRARARLQAFRPSGGNPACSIPAGTVDGLPVGLQVIGRHHEDALLLDLARIMERERPWPLVAPRV
jgi:Asp-tRNA(Asn)/Glu-tRNA(Gln) amidotransferase A subunit family amidase